jgi:glucoamylase
LQVWKTNRHARSVARGGRLRILTGKGFTLHWSKNEWHDVEDTMATPTPFGFYYVDIDALATDKSPIRFTFKWRDSGEWEGRDYAVTIED